MSMPFIELSPFLHNGDESMTFKIKSVNALYRAFSISTVVAAYEPYEEDGVSMPFIGLSPFLRSPLGTP